MSGNTTEQGPKTAESNRPVRRKVHVNGRFLLILVITVAGLGTGTYALHFFQMNRNADSLLRLAEEAEGEGELSDAMSYLAQYIRFRPKDYDAKLRYANIAERYSQSGRTLTRVHALLEDVLRNDVDRADVAEIRRRVVELSLRLGRFQTALDHLKSLREEQPQASPADLASLEGRAHQGLAEYTVAVIDYLSAIRHSPATVEHYVRLAVLLQRQPTAIPYRGYAQTKVAGLNTDVLSAFPQRNQGKKEKEKEKPATADARTAFGLTAAERQDIVAGIYAALVKHGKPRHAALLARSRYLLARQEKDDLKLARVDADAALKAAPRDPEVLHHVADLTIAQAAEVFVEPVDKKDFARELQRQNGFLKSAEEIARRGLALKKPDRFQFHAPLARVTRQRSRMSTDDTVRDEQRQLAERQIDDGLAALTDFRKSDQATDTSLARELLLHEIELRTLKVELLLGRASKPNGEIDEEIARRAEAERRRLAELGASNVRLELFKAQSLLLHRQWREALEILVLARRRLRRDRTLRRQVDFAMAKCHDQLNNPAGRIQALLGGLNVDSNWHNGRLALAGMLAEEDRLDDAKEHYRYLISKGQSRAVVPFLRLQVREQARRPAARRNLAAVYKNLDAAKKDGRDPVALALLRIDATNIDRSIPDARRIATITRLFDRSLAAHPKNALLHAARARFEAARTDRDQKQRLPAALQRLAESRSQVDEPIVIDLARANLCGRLPKDRARTELQALEKRAADYKAAQREAVLNAVANGYARAGLSEESFALRRKLAAHSPNNLTARLAAALQALQNGEPKALNAELAEIRRIEGAGGPWGNYVEALGIVFAARGRMTTAGESMKNLAEEKRLKASKAVLAEVQPKLERAQQLLNRTSRMRPLWPEPAHQLGRVAAMLGNSEEAYRQYRKAIDLGDRSSGAFTFAVQHLLSKREFERADELIKLAGGAAAALLSPDRVNLADRRRSLPELAMQVAYARGEIQRAMSFIPEDSNDYRQKILLAILKFAEHRRLSESERKSPKGAKILNEARRLHDQAVQLAGDTPGPWISLVSFLARNDQAPEAVAVIRTAMTKLNEDAKWITAARCFVILGKHDEAQRHFLEAVRRRPKSASLRLSLAGYYSSRREWKHAAGQLTLVLRGETDATNLQLAAARHLNVQAAASGGRYADMAAALKMLDPVETSSLQDLYTRVAILQKSSLKNDRRELIRVLEIIHRRRELTPDQRFQLARLYERVGRWNEADRLVQTLLKRNPENTLWRAWYTIEILSNEGSTTQAVQKARREFEALRALDPNSLTTAMTHARLLVAENDPRGEATNVLKDAVTRFVQHRPQRKPAATAQLVSVARLAERLSLPRAAEFAYEQQARLSGKPEARLMLAMFLGREERQTEALQICVPLAKAPKTLTPAAVAAVRIVMTGNPTRAHLKTVEEIVQAALKANPESTNAQLIQAEYLTAAQRIPEAEALYRKLLRSAPRNFALLNNLAWLLAIENRELPEALRSIETAIEVAGPYPQLLDTRSTVLTRMKQTNRAIADSKQALDQSPDPAFYLHLAQAHFAAGDKPAAAAAMKEAIAQGLSPKRLHRLEHAGWRAMLANTADSQ